jgi:hypothetical protein
MAQKTVWLVYYHDTEARDSVASVTVHATEESARLHCREQVIAMTIEMSEANDTNLAEATLRPLSDEQLQRHFLDEGMGVFHCWYRKATVHTCTTAEEAQKHLE